MKYNENAFDYEEYLKLIKEELAVQRKYYERIKLLRASIAELEEKLSSKMIDMDRISLVNELMRYNEEINDFTKEVYQSKEKQHFYEQYICAHEFGLILSMRRNDEGRIISNGICLECDAELNDIEGKIFTHGIKLKKEIRGAMNIEDYKHKLKRLKKAYEYEKSSEQYTIGEQIVTDLVEEAKSLKKMYSRLK